MGSSHIGHDGHATPLQENLRQLCVFKLANESGKPWLWWEYVTKFGDECSMVDRTYDEDCAEKVHNTAPRQRVVLSSLLHHCSECTTCNVSTAAICNSYPCCYDIPLQSIILAE